MTSLQRNRTEKDISPKQIIETFERAFKLVYDRNPHIVHVTGEWYRVNGEIVHRLTLLGEISRLRHLAQKQKLMNADKGIIQRLISKLRNI